MLQDFKKKSRLFNQTASLFQQSQISLSAYPPSLAIFRLVEQYSVFNFYLSYDSTEGNRAMHITIMNAYLCFVFLSVDDPILF